MSIKELWKSKKSKMTLLSVIGISILACTAGFVTYALLRDQTKQLTNTFELGNVTTEIREDFKPTDVATTFEKKPVVVNTGKNDCYVRVRVTASPEKALIIGGWNTGEGETEWTQDGEYYYYNKAIVHGESTTPLFTTVSVKEEYIDTLEGFEVTVYQEAVQSKMNARDGSYTTNQKEIWDAYEKNQIPETFEKTE